MTTFNKRGSSWLRLWRHSYRLFAGWVLRVAQHRGVGMRVALIRALVPLDPWRYYELSRVADEPFAGDCLDVASPKLLPSLLQHEGRGNWTAVDLNAREIEGWQAVDLDLRLAVEDATRLSFADESFDACLCVSVIEHVPGTGDTTAMAEMWRVLRPSGVLHLTTPVASAEHEFFIGEKIYGAASRRGDSGTVFFERHYTSEAIERRLLALPWEIEHREYARQRDGRWERRFYSAAPWSYVAGSLLPLVCARNFEVGPHVPDLADRHHGVVYLRLRKPGIR